jgi:hypothetical protein
LTRFRQPMDRGSVYGYDEGSWAFLMGFVVLEPMNFGQQRCAA